MTMREVDNFMRKNGFTEVLHADSIITMIEAYVFPPSKQDRLEKINDLARVHYKKHGKKLVL